MLPLERLMPFRLYLQLLLERTILQMCVATPVAHYDVVGRARSAERARHEMLPRWRFWAIRQRVESYRIPAQPAFVAEPEAKALIPGETERGTHPGKHTQARLLKAFDRRSAAGKITFSYSILFGSYCVSQKNQKETNSMGRPSTRQVADAIVHSARACDAPRHCPRARVEEGP